MPRSYTRALTAADIRLNAQHSGKDPDLYVMERIQDVHELLEEKQKRYTDAAVDLKIQNFKNHQVWRADQVKLSTALMGYSTDLQKAKIQSITDLAVAHSQALQRTLTGRTQDVATTMAAANEATQNLGQDNPTRAGAAWQAALGTFSTAGVLAPGNLSLVPAYQEMLKAYGSPTAAFAASPAEYGGLISTAKFYEEEYNRRYASYEALVASTELQKQNLEDGVEAIQSGNSELVKSVGKEMLAQVPAMTAQAAGMTADDIEIERAKLQQQDADLTGLRDHLDYLNSRLAAEGKAPPNPDQIIASYISSEKFQRWAADNGFEIGVAERQEDGVYRYSPGRDDKRALDTMIRQSGEPADKRVPFLPRTNTREWLKVQYTDADGTHTVSGKRLPEHAAAPGAMRIWTDTGIVLVPEDSEVISRSVQEHYTPRQLLEMKRGAKHKETAEEAARRPIDDRHVPSKAALRLAERHAIRSGKSIEEAPDVETRGLGREGLPDTPETPKEEVALADRLLQEKKTVEGHGKSADVQKELNLAVDIARHIPALARPEAKAFAAFMERGVKGDDFESALEKYTIYSKTQDRPTAEGVDISETDFSILSDEELKGLIRKDLVSTRPELPPETWPRPKPDFSGFKKPETAPEEPVLSGEELAGGVNAYQPGDVIASDPETGAEYVYAELGGQGVIDINTETHSTGLSPYSSDVLLVAFTKYSLSNEQMIAAMNEASNLGNSPEQALDRIGVYEMEPDPVVLRAESGFMVRQSKFEESEALGEELKKRYPGLSETERAAVASYAVLGSEDLKKFDSNGKLTPFVQTGMERIDLLGENGKLDDSDRIQLLAVLGRAPTPSERVGAAAQRVGEGVKGAAQRTAEGSKLLKRSLVANISHRRRAGLERQQAEIDAKAAEAKSETSAGIAEFNRQRANQLAVAASTPERLSEVEIPSMPTDPSSSPQTATREMKGLKFRGEGQRFTRPNVTGLWPKKNATTAGSPAQVADSLAAKNAARNNKQGIPPAPSEGETQPDYSEGQTKANDEPITGGATQ
jgi:hypothetical protein